MLVKHTPSTFEKLHVLGGMATDDILARPQPRNARQPYTVQARNDAPGVYRAAMPNGKFINLMRVMFTDFCMMDCHFCPNSYWVPRKRYGFKVDELANAFMEMHRRQTVAGLFLSSGIAGSASKTTERLIQVVEIIRKKHGFKGYIHMKVMPGTEYQYVEAAHRLGTRLSINIEAPTVEHMRKLSAMKDLERDILKPMSWIADLIRDKSDAGRQSVPAGSGKSERELAAAPSAVGQATQLVVGASDESDWDIYERMDQLYSEWNFKRVYYSPFQPIRHTPLEEHPVTPMIREHRLYQVDWLRRVYKFTNDEMKLAFDDRGFLSSEDDPKTAIAVENLDSFPVDVNAATRDMLLRVPGVGPVSADRILKNRRAHAVDNWRDLQAMGVVRKRAWPFLYFPGHRPPRAKQLRLDLFSEGAPRRIPDSPALQGSIDACASTGSCAGCPMFGAPGHPGPAG
ncbi:MAG: putative DNA modification/repair radical SAM protein [Chloroflexi bacterium]|nr:putative DNA modification/repair radical SAM protein [Chloroflexota bacterium]